MIEIASLSRARKIKRRFEAVLTIEDPVSHNGLRFHKQPRPDHLILNFHDLDFPLPGLLCATPNQINQALEFCRGRGKLLIHCQAGIGRSAAIALAVLAEQMGAGCEEEALAEMFRIRPIASPSIMTVKAADIALGTGGRLEEALLENESRRPDALEFRATKAKFWTHESKMRSKAGVAP